MKWNKLFALLAAGCLAAGCTGTSSQDTAGKSDDTAEQSESQPEALAALSSAVDDDDKALEAWTTILNNTASMYDYKFEIGGDGYVYEYQESQAGMIEDNYRYDISRDDVFKSDGTTAYTVQLTDIDDSNETLLHGYGLIGAYGSDQTGAYVTLTNTDNNLLEGTVEKTYSDLGSDVDQKAADELMDAYTNFWYVRTVDPMQEASLYDWDFEKDGDGWKATVKVKDLDNFRKETTIKGVLIDNRTDRPVLAMDEIENDNWTFSFDSNGNLMKSENQIFHVMSALDKDGYVNVQNDAEVGKALDDELNVDTIKSFLASISDGSLKSGESFSLKDWE